MIRAELRRLWGVPSAWITMLIGVVIAPLMTTLTALQIHRNLDDGRPGSFTDTGDLGFGEVHMLLPCAIVFGVLAVGQEITSGPGRRGSGRERTTVHLAFPRRRRHAYVFGTLVMTSAAVCAGLALIASRAIAQSVVGAPEWGPDVTTRAAGLMATWAVLALLASALTWLTRSIVIPLVALVIGSSLTPLSYLLSSVTPWARYLPDLAGTGLALQGSPVEPLPAVTAILTLTAWVLSALLIAAEVVARRDS